MKCDARDHFRHSGVFCGLAGSGGLFVTDAVGLVGSSFHSLRAPREPPFTQPALDSPTQAPAKSGAWLYSQRGPRCANMVDERFSGEAFEAAGLDTPESRALSDALADAVSREMIGAVSARLREIVVELNRMGHKLQLEQSEPDCVAFRDESGVGASCASLLTSSFPPDTPICSRLTPSSIVMPASSSP